MRTLSITVLILAALAAPLAADQKISSTPLSTPRDSAPGPVAVDSIGPGVTAPRTIPTDLLPIVSSKCRKKLNGTAVLSFYVDTTGRPRNLIFLRPLGNDLDRIALKVVESERFTPAKSNGIPVVVAETAGVKMRGCIDESLDPAGQKIHTLRLRSNPVRTYRSVFPPPAAVILVDNEPSWLEKDSQRNGLFRIGGPVTSPVLLNRVEPHYSSEARSKEIQGSCLYTVIVDRQGMPRRIRVIRSLDPALDENGAEAIERYRFKPAMKDGEPVPVLVTVEINFRL